MREDLRARYSREATRDLKRLWVVGSAAVVAGLSLAAAAWPHGYRNASGSMLLVWAGGLLYTSGLVALVVAAVAKGYELGRLAGRGAP